MPPAGAVTGVVVVLVNFSANNLIAIIHSRITRSVLAPNINGLLLALQCTQPIAYIHNALTA